jgi:hypothetical protein
MGSQGRSEGARAWVGHHAIWLLGATLAAAGSAAAPELAATGWAVLGLAGLQAFVEANGYTAPHGSAVRHGQRVVVFSREYEPGPGAYAPDFSVHELPLTCSRGSDRRARVV